VRKLAVLIGATAALSGFLPAAFGDAPAADPSADWSDSPAAYSRGPDRREYDPVWEFSLGLGYSRVEFDGDPPLVDGRDCLHAEPVLSVSPFAAAPQLRLGAAVGWTIAVDETRGAVVSDDGGLVAATSSDVSFMLFEPELRLSWRQPLGPDGFYFIEPGVAAGAAVGWLDVAGRDPSGTGTGSVDFTETDASFQWKVFLRAGIPFSNGLAGLEASYMRAGRLQFADDIGGEPSEFYIGIWGALQF
jgi:hypothetical protein